MKNQFVEFSSKTPNPQLPGVFDIDPNELLKKANDVFIVDVRQPDEYVGELKHIAQAQLIVLDQLATSASKLPKDKTIVFVCRSGGRSGKATAWALANGFQNVFNMKGGMLLWNELRLPTQA